MAIFVKDYFRTLVDKLLDTDNVSERNAIITDLVTHFYVNGEGIFEQSDDTSANVVMTDDDVASFEKEITDSGVLPYPFSFTDNPVAERIQNGFSRSFNSYLWADVIANNPDNNSAIERLNTISKLFEDVEDLNAVSRVPRSRERRMPDLFGQNGLLSSISAQRSELLDFSTMQDVPSDLNGPVKMSSISRFGFSFLKEYAISQIAVIINGIRTAEELGMTPPDYFVRYFELTNRPLEDDERTERQTNYYDRGIAENFSFYEEMFETLPSRQPESAVEIVPDVDLIETDVPVAETVTVGTNEQTVGEASVPTSEPLPVEQTEAPSPVSDNPVSDDLSFDFLDGYSSFGETSTTAELSDNDLPFEVNDEPEAEIAESDEASIQEEIVNDQPEQVSAEIFDVPEPDTNIINDNNDAPSDVTAETESPVSSEPENEPVSETQVTETPVSVPEPEVVPENVNTDVSDNTVDVAPEPIPLNTVDDYSVFGMDEPASEPTPVEEIPEPISNVTNDDPVTNTVNDITSILDRPQVIEPVPEAPISVLPIGDADSPEVMEARIKMQEARLEKREMELEKKSQNLEVREKALAEERETYKEETTKAVRNQLAEAFINNIIKMQETGNLLISETGVKMLDISKHAVDGIVNISANMPEQAVPVSSEKVILTTDATDKSPSETVEKPTIPVAENPFEKSDAEKILEETSIETRIATPAVSPDVLNGFNSSVILDQIKKSPSAINWMKPTFGNHMKAVSENGLALQFIPKQNYFLQAAAVKQNGLALEFAHNPSFAVKKAAMKQNVDSIAYIDRLSLKETLFALKCMMEQGKADDAHIHMLCSKGYLNGYVCNKIVSLNPNNIQFLGRTAVPDHVYLKSVIGNPWNIAFVPVDRQNAKMQEIAVQRDPKSIRAIENAYSSLEPAQHAPKYLYVAAISKDPSVLNEMPNDIKAEFAHDFDRTAPQNDEL